jgi:hypothetical protein
MILAKGAKNASTTLNISKRIVNNYSYCLAARGCKAELNSATDAPRACIWRSREQPLDHRDQLALGIRIAVNVPLGGLDGPVPGQKLNIA